MRNYELSLFFHRKLHLLIVIFGILRAFGFLLYASQFREKKTNY